MAEGIALSLCLVMIISAFLKSVLDEHLSYRAAEIYNDIIFYSFVGTVLSTFAWIWS